jgi:hypothetical protein
MGVPNGTRNGLTAPSRRHHPLEPLVTRLVCVVLKLAALHTFRNGLSGECEWREGRMIGPP